MKKFDKAGLRCFFAAIILASVVACNTASVYDDDATILKGADSGSKTSSVSNNTGDSYTHRAASFSGMETVRTVKKDGSLALDINLSISSGRFKLVLAGGNQVYTVCDQNISGQVDLSGLPNGTYKLKIVGDHASFDLSVQNW
ncbi:MAG: hypothetical protein LBT11_01600 [Treponema sp.]|jgi:hypothetical protein|nr:hypothetical protein [Treponema sp.]